MDIHDSFFERREPDKTRIYGKKTINTILIEHDIEFIISSEHGVWRIISQGDLSDVINGNI